MPTMLDFLSAWYKRYFTDPQAALLVVLLVVSAVVLAYMGQMLAPLLAALVIAYLLEGLVKKKYRNIHYLDYYQ